MKILCISDAWLPQINGVVRTYQAVGQILRSQGHEFQVIGPDAFKFTLPVPGYPEIRLAMLAWWTLPQLIRAFRPDCIHIATEGPLGWAARHYCLKHNLSFTTCYHSQFPDYVAVRAGKIFGRLTTAILHRFHTASARVMTSTASLDAQLRELGYTAPLHRFSRGVDSGAYNNLAQPHCFATLQRPVALYVGRVAIEKNLEAFLEASWQGSKVIVGNGPALKHLCKRYPDAIFAGIKTGPDLVACYQSADVFAFPSRTDTFGLVLLEALAAGLPVAAYPVPGPRDIITSPALGSLDEDFGTALERALQSPGSPVMRHDHVVEHYSWDRATGQFLEGLVPATK